MYDVIIIGSGPAGISASLYTKRSNLNTLIISKKKGVLDKVKRIDNYYGVELGTTGNQLEYIGEKQAIGLGIEIKKEEVVQIDYDEKFIVKTLNNEYEARTIILATGSNRKTINVKGIKELEGKGISYCATCDAIFFKNKNIAVLGNGEYALHEIEELKPIVNSITMLTNGEEAISKRGLNIEIEEKRIREFIGTDRIKEVEFEDNTTRKLDGIFIAMGTASASNLARKLGIMLDKKNNIKVDQNMKTNINGVYACGDCTGGILQIAKAVYEGMIAAMSAIKFLKIK